MTLIFKGLGVRTRLGPHYRRRAKLPKTQQDSAIQWLEDSGISVKGMFILGMPEDNVANIDKTLDFVKNLPVTYLQFSVFTPYPGTPIYDQYKHLVKATKYEDYTQWDLIFDHANLTPQDVKVALDKFYKQSYLTPKRFFKMTTRLSAIQAELMADKIGSKLVGSL